MMEKQADKQAQTRAEAAPKKKGWIGFWDVYGVILGLIFIAIGAGLGYLWQILGDYELAITATTVRVPVFDSHSEAINVELASEFEVDDVKKLLAASPGIVLMDDPMNNLYPLARFAAGRDEVFVGRVRRDFSVENGVNLWVVADNIRKGAATNAVQIAEALLRQ